MATLAQVERIENPVEELQVPVIAVKACTSITTWEKPRSTRCAVSI